MFVVAELFISPPVNTQLGGQRALSQMGFEINQTVH